MKKVLRHLDPVTLAVILLTLALFVLALFLKGISHDLVLEAGVFLVSVKLIFLVYHNRINAENIQSKLDQIHGSIRSLNREQAAHAKPGQEAERS